MSIPGEFGVMLVGGLVSAMLYGITILQTYVYYMHYYEDSSIMKFIVAAIWILDTSHLLIMCHMLYYYLITNYGDLMSLEYDIWSFPASLVMELVVVIVVQCFFAHKIYYFCRPQMRWLVTAPILLLLLAQFGFGIETIVLLFTDNTFSSASQITLYSGLPFSATFLLAEVLITVSLCVLLYDSRSRSAFPRSKRLLTTLIIYAVNRGLLSLLVALIEFLATVTSQGTWLTGLDFIIPRLYANSLLASLNTRQYLRSQNSGTRSGERINTVHFMNLQKHSEGLERSNDGDKHIEAIVIDITADSALNKTTSFRSEGEAQF